MSRILRYATESAGRAYQRHLTRRFLFRLSLGLLLMVCVGASAYWMLRGFGIVRVETGGTSCWAVVEGERFDLEQKSTFVTRRWCDIEAANMIQTSATDGYIVNPGLELQDGPFIAISPKDREIECYLLTFKRGYRNLTIITKWRRSRQ